MKRFASLSILALLLNTLAIAQSGTPSSKATAADNSAVACSLTATSGTWSCADIFSGAAKPGTADNYVEVMGSTVKVSNSQSLFASASLAGDWSVYQYAGHDEAIENLRRNEYFHGSCFWRSVLARCTSGRSQRQPNYVWLSCGGVHQRDSGMLWKWS
jgi:hypothetical protein